MAKVTQPQSTSSRWGWPLLAGQHGALVPTVRIGVAINFSFASASASVQQMPCLPPSFHPGAGDHNLVTGPQSWTLCSKRAHGHLALLPLWQSPAPYIAMALGRCWSTNIQGARLRGHSEQGGHQGVPRRGPQSSKRKGPADKLPQGVPPTNELFLAGGSWWRSDEEHGLPDQAAWAPVCQSCHLLATDKLYELGQTSGPRCLHPHL